MVFDGESREKSQDTVTNIYICPPEPHVETDEDSANEDDGGLIDNLSRRQLAASAEIDYNNDENENGSFDNYTEDLKKNVAPNKQKKGNSCGKKNLEKRVWINGDLTNNRQFPPADYSYFQNMSPLELFYLFFDEEFWVHIMSETKKYALFKNCADPDIKLQEMKSCFGILILSGYHSLSSRRFYWDQKEDMGVPMVKNAMRRNRFEQILRFLHFADNTKINPDDKMWKLRPLMKHLKSNFLKYYQPTEHINYDESMIRYYGRHNCKQFIRGKPIRFGYKAWCLNSENGYLINFELYQGKTTNSNETYVSDFGSATAPLVTMLDELPNPHLSYQIFVDNLFTSFKLLLELNNRGYGVTGTLRENRFPKDCPLTEKKAMSKLERGTFESAISKDEGIIVARWMDNAVVTVASTSCGIQPVTMVKRYSKSQKKIINVPQPHLIREYNKYMGGTDRMDEDIGHCRIALRGQKWYWAIFTWLVDVSVHNAWVLYRQSSPERRKVPNILFRREIAQMLIQQYVNPPSRPGRPAVGLNSLTLHRVSDDLRYDRKDHLVVSVPDKKRRRCAGEGCSSVGRTQCNKCNVGLCIECFLPFHTK